MYILESYIELWIKDRIKTQMIVLVVNATRALPKRKLKTIGSRLMFSKISLTELVLKRRSASLLIKPFLELYGRRDEKCVYWKVSVGLKCVEESWKSRSFENLSVEENSAFWWHFIHKHLIVWWKELAKFTKSAETSVIWMFHLKRCHQYIFSKQHIFVDWPLVVVFRDLP